MVSKKKSDVPEEVSKTTLDAQEHLSVKRLKALTCKTVISGPHDRPRPESSIIELMNWVVARYSSRLMDQEGLEKFVHGNFIIDGQFLHFCDLNDITVEVLQKDSTMSWSTEDGFEKFFCQGVFRISSEDVEFLFSSLMHKSTGWEDEIFSFAVVSAKNYEAYIALREQFDAWVMQRDRSNLNIRVVDGEDIHYARDQHWDDLFLPETLKTEIKSLVENFLNSKEFYEDNKIPWKRGCIFYGPPGNGKTSIVKTIISNYNFKPITISPGAGDDALFESFLYAEEQSPSLLYFEDIDSMLDRNVDLSLFLDLMDGISAKNGLLVIATANEINRLKPSIIDRPSRFDRKFLIPPPTKEMAVAYLQKWFGKVISEKKIQDLAKQSEQYGLSYAFLKELYISTMFEALSNNRKVPNEKDTTKALEKLMKDKHIVKSGKKTINIDNYVR